MDPRNDEQTELLRGIWNEIKELGKNLGSRIDQTNAKLEQTRNELSARIDQTNAKLEQTRNELSARIDQTNERIEELRDELSTRITKSEIRTATAIIDLDGTLGQVKTLLAGRLDLRDRVARCENDIEDIKQRLGA
jgi:predicted  nucleic acid-binding Zn-ribbon protein